VVRTDVSPSEKVTKVGGGGGRRMATFPQICGTSPVALLDLTSRICRGKRPFRHYILSYIIDNKIDGGRGGIRTPDTLSGTPVFKTGAINHSATLPFRSLVWQWQVAQRFTYGALVLALLDLAGGASESGAPLGSWGKRQAVRRVS
jgi:hypothetical protein